MEWLEHRRAQHVRGWCFVICGVQLDAYDADGGAGCCRYARSG